ncbi:hypothetical protein DFH06DRAFT_1166777 [Mycena polygramma]|nr:hypothetical protein DFH06DRAFT_1166777 [Mycena polygramma]
MSNDGDVYEVWGILGHEDDPNIPRPVPSNKPSASTEKPATPAPIATTKPVPSSKHKPPDSSISSPGRYPIIPFKRNLIPQLHENSLRAALRGPWIDLGQDALPKPASPAASRSISPTQSNDPSPTNQGGDTSGCVAKARASNSSKKSPANGGGRVIQRSVNTARMRAAPYNLAARKILPAPSSSNAPSASSDVSNQTPCLAPGPANQFSTFTKPGPVSPPRL